MGIKSFFSSETDLSAQVLALLDGFTHPTLQQPLSTLHALKQASLRRGELTIRLVMPFAWQSGFVALQQATEASLLQLPDVRQLRWIVEYQIATLKRVNEQPGVKGIKNILAVTSGKGGVGKSSTAVNLALALAAEGANVGLLDADIYGPSIPLMLGSEDQRPTSPDGQHMVPVSVHGIVANSIGYLVEQDNATIWRGPMASRALGQLLNETWWPELDYLVIDMPPGTGDIQLTLSQQTPVTAAIVVTTPQDVALLDAAKGIAMFEKVHVPVLGVVENMSMHICSQCGFHEAIFGTGGAARLAEKYQVELLAQIPLHIQLREDLDNGTPTVAAKPDSEFSLIYRQLAGKIAAKMYWSGESIATEILVRNIN